MRTSKKVNGITFLGLMVVAAIVVAFLMGRYTAKSEYAINRENRCRNLITFAVDKAENYDLTDVGVMDALISNVYAAYEYCDTLAVAERLHDLWNRLLFDKENFTGKEDLVKELNIILEMLDAEE